MFYSIVMMRKKIRGYLHYFLFLFNSTFWPLWHLSFEEGAVVKVLTTILCQLRSETFEKLFSKTQFLQKNA